MLRPEPTLATACATVFLLWSLIAHARDEPPRRAVPPPAPSASASASSAPRHLDPEEEAAPLPAGHPAVRPDDEDEDGEPPPTTPRAAPSGMFQPPPDTANEDPSLPAGTIVVDIRGPDDQPIPNASLVLTVLHQSVARGQSKENRPTQADAGGHLRLDHLETGTSVSYWIKDLVGPAVFATVPVQLNAMHGMHEVMHVYPVVRDIADALVVMQGAIFFEVKDDRVQVEEAISLFNFGKTAFFPDNLIVPLPKGFTALTSPAAMSDQGVDAKEHVGARIHGTFAPGRHDLEFRWQLPYDGEPDLSIDVGLPPHIAVMRVMAAAGHETRLVVDGFPDAQRRPDNQGQHVLVTEKQVRRDEPLSTVHVSIHGLLTAGPARVAATFLASATVLVGLVLGTGRKSSRKGGAKSERQALLTELEELERAHLQGDVGPKTYERARRQLIDAIAETLDPAA